MHTQHLPSFTNRMGRPTSQIRPARSPAMVTLQYNPFVPETHANPYPLYQQLRESDPIHWSELLDGWILTRYDDVVAVLKDLRFSADRRRARAARHVQALAGRHRRRAGRAAGAARGAGARAAERAGDGPVLPVGDRGAPQ